jgi:hypothetical protein
MRIIPVNFSHANGYAMLQHAKSLTEDPDGLVAIHPSFDNLLIALRTASVEGNRLKKENIDHNDILDAFILSLNYYKRQA